MWIATYVFAVLAVNLAFTYEPSLSWLWSLGVGFVFRALHLKSEGGNAFMRTMSRKGVRSALPEKLVEKIDNPISFKPLSGDLADGYEAETSTSRSSASRGSVAIRICR